MKKLCLFVLLFTSVILLNAQTGFRSVSYKQAMELAEKENKLIFLQIEATHPSTNVLSNIAFSDKELSGILAGSFIAIKMSPSDADRLDIIKKFGLAENTWGTLYLDAN